MIKEFSFHFKDLEIDLSLIHKVLGYSDGNFPEPFGSYLDEAMQEAEFLNDIKACYRIIDIVNFESKYKITAGGIEFKMGKTIYNELLGSENLAFYICTAGKTISEKSSALLKGDDPALGYIYDLLGSAITEAVADSIQQHISNEVQLYGQKITNRYSAGYCNWSVAEQHKLFSFFGDFSSGVRLTNSALMYPVKSTSGIIGIGKEVKYRDYQCTLCKSIDCVYRKEKGH